MTDLELLVIHSHYLQVQWFYNALFKHIPLENLSLNVASEGLNKKENLAGCLRLVSLILDGQRFDSLKQKAHGPHCSHEKTVQIDKHI